MAAVEIQGHRGYGDLAPHNTMAAFRKAAADPNVKSVEFDVRGTSDGHLIITHGPELFAEKTIESQTLAELQSVDLGDGERVPLLSDVVDACLQGNLYMNVEIKSGDGAERTLKTIALLRSKNAMSSCCISSFDREILRVVVESAPEVPIGSLYHVGLRLVDPDDASKGVVYAQEPEDFATWLDRKVEGDSVNLRAEAVLKDASMVEKVRKAGKKVMVWCSSQTPPGYEESEATHRQLVDLGVDIICCNRPDVLTEVLKGKQKPPRDIVPEVVAAKAAAKKPDAISATAPAKAKKQDKAKATGKAKAKAKAEGKAKAKAMKRPAAKRTRTS